MTHKDIYTKFMIEYDKANVTSSYPHLTQYEIATLLDKAYDIVVDRKFTGTNVRRSYFESDIKSIADLQPLITHRLLFLGSDGDEYKSHNPFPKNIAQRSAGIPVHQFEREDDENNSFSVSISPDGCLRSMPDNLRSVNLPSDMLYFIAAAIPQDIHDFAGWMNDDRADDKNLFAPMDSKLSDREDKMYKWIRYTPATLVSHKIAENFYATSTNIPWVPNPMCYIEGNRLYIVVDPIVGVPSLSYTDPDSNTVKSGEWASVTYLMNHKPFVKDIDGIRNAIYNYGSEGTISQYTVSQDWYFKFKLDRFNLIKEEEPLLWYSKAGDNRIHVNDMIILNTNVSSVYDESSTYYFVVDEDREIDVLTFDLIKQAVDPYTREGYIDGIHVKTVQRDDSTNVKPGEKLVICRIGWSNASSEYANTATPFFVFTYDYLYSLLYSRNYVSKPIFHASSVPLFYGENSDVQQSEYTYVDTTYTEEMITFRSKDLQNVQKIIPANQPEIGRTVLQYTDLGLFDFQINSSDYNRYKDIITYNGVLISQLYQFELTDSVANEVISTAITFALENVESARLNSHSQISTLES